MLPRLATLSAQRQETRLLLQFLGKPKKELKHDTTCVNFVIGSWICRRAKASFHAGDAICFSFTDKSRNPPSKRDVVADVQAKNIIKSHVVAPLVNVTE